MTKQERIDLEREAEAYAEKYKNLKPNEQSLIALAYLDGRKEEQKLNEYARSLIRSLLDNSDEYARQRAEEFLQEREQEE